MAFFRRFASGLAAGFVAGPALTGATVVMCEEPKSSMKDMLSSFSFSSIKQSLQDGMSASEPDAEVLATIPIRPAACTFPIAQGGDSDDKTWGVAWYDDWDNPENLDCEQVPSPSADPTRVPKRQRQILLIRHGQYENESAHDDSIRRLTPLGREQATVTGAYLAACFAQVARRDDIRAARKEAHKFHRSREALLTQAEAAGTESEGGLRVLRADVEQAKASLDAHRTAEKSAGPSFLIASRPANIYVSNLLRAKETARLVLDGFPDAEDLKKRLVVDEDLRERFPCDPQPRYPRHVAKAHDQRAVERAYQRYFHRPVRADEAGAINGKSVDIIVGHGNLIRYFALRALQLPPEAWLRQSVMHASITSIVISDNGKVKIHALGSFGHLPPAMATVENIGYNASGTN